MAGNPNQKLKLLYIADYLRKHTDAEHPASIEKIVGYLQTVGITAERKSVSSDIEVLITYGLPIEHCRIAPRGYYLDGTGFETCELVMLINALQASPVISKGKTTMLVGKLKQLVDDYQCSVIDSLLGADGSITERFGGRGGLEKSENEELYYSIDAISTAISQGKKISFIYQHRRLVGNLPVFDNGREFIVSPYAAIWNQDRYYLVGNYDKYDNLSHYRIDRMRLVNVLDEPVRPINEVSRYSTRLDTFDYSRDMFNMFSGGEIMSITLECTMNMLETVVERFGLNNAYRKLSDDLFSIKIKTNVNEGFIKWILGFGGSITVTEPQSLCDEIKTRLKEMLDAY